MKNWHILSLLAAILPLSTSLFAQSAMSGATTEIGSPPHFVMAALAEAARQSKNIDVNLEFPDDIAGAQVAVAKGQVDFATIPVITTLLMRRGLGAFRFIGSVQGQNYADQLRVVTGFNAGVYHALTFADSGIEDWDDFRDKRVFVGTQNDGSSTLVQRLIKLVTGYKANDEYEAVKMNWTDGITGLLNGSVDVVIRPGAAPADFVDRILSSSDRKLRILGIPAEIAEGDRYQKFSTAPGSLPSFIPVKHYDSDRIEITNGGSTIAVMMAVVVNHDIDHDLVYGITKRYIEGFDDLSVAKPWVDSLILQAPFTGLHEK